MDIVTDMMLPQIRLMYLVSPSLPVGAYSYSQGIEWAVETGWVRDKESLQQWIADLMKTSVTFLEVPLLARLYKACEVNDDQSVIYWTNYLVASRETMELRQEEANRARALTVLLPEINIPISINLRPAVESCYLTGFAYAAEHMEIPLTDAITGYIWGWLENLTLAGVKIIPLGQTAGQKILNELLPQIPDIVSEGLKIDNDEIGASCSAQAIASSLHETQYTRIYRS